jgi:anionic cell wall polymer biosynthesis LytR-Cps2A-Psr (LCP) family protein
MVWSAAAEGLPRSTEGCHVLFHSRAGASARRSRLALIVLLAVALTGSGTVPFTAAANTGLLRPSALLDLAMHFAPSPAVLRALENGEAINYGKDARLTFLLLGTDYRAHAPGKGERPDIIMVMTINRTTGKMAVASLPRDLNRIPLPNGEVHTGRINAIPAKYVKTLGRAGAYNKMREIVGHLLDVEIDYVATMRFSNFDTMMDELGSIRVTTRQARDPKLLDAEPPGVYFPAATNYELYGTGQKCAGHFRFTTNDKLPGYYCHRALVYARTRKGPGNSDFKRQARGVDIVLAAISRAAGDNYGKGKIGSMTSKAQAQGLGFWSSLPMNAGNATELYGLLKKAKLGSVNRVVFTPTKYATKNSGAATYRVNVTAIRNWIKNNFKNI